MAVAAEEGPGRLAVLVEASDGAPEVGARVFVGRGEELLDEGKTDEAGRAELAAARGEGWIVVVPVGARAHRQTGSLGPGEIRIRLAPGDCAR